MQTSWVFAKTVTFYCFHCYYSSLICRVSILVPMDLDVKMKAVMIGACMLIVSAILSCMYTFKYVYFQDFMFFEQQNNNNN